MSEDCEIEISPEGVDDDSSYIDTDVSDVTVDDKDVPSTSVLDFKTVKNTKRKKYALDKSTSVSKSNVNFKKPKIKKGDKSKKFH